MNITKTFIGAACLFLSTAAISSEEPPLEEGDVVTQDPILIPLRMSISGNPVIKIRNRANQVLFLEVLSDGETGGEALYEDDRGKILEVKWDDQRIIYFDSHPCHHFKNIIVPEHYQVEEIKSLGEMIGSTSTIISRNGHGGIVRARGGSLAEQLLELQDLSERVLSHLPDNTEQEIKNLRESFFTGLSLVNNSVTVLNEKVANSGNSVNEVVNVLSQLSQFLKESKVVVNCDSKENAVY